MQRDPKILFESSKVLKIILRSKQAREESPWKGKNALSGGQNTKKLVKNYISEALTVEARQLLYLADQRPISKQLIIINAITEEDLRRGTGHRRSAISDDRISGSHRQETCVVIVINAITEEDLRRGTGHRRSAISDD